jgi:hypothetical protein
MSGSDARRFGIVFVDASTSSTPDTPLSATNGVQPALQLSAPTILGQLLGSWSDVERLVDDDASLPSSRQFQVQRGGQISGRRYEFRVLSPEVLVPHVDRLIDAFAYEDKDSSDSSSSTDWLVSPPKQKPRNFLTSDNCTARFIVARTVTIESITDMRRLFESTCANLFRGDAQLTVTQLDYLRETLAVRELLDREAYLQRPPLTLANELRARLTNCAPVRRLFVAAALWLERRVGDPATRLLRTINAATDETELRAQRIKIERGDQVVFADGTVLRRVDADDNDDAESPDATLRYFVSAALGQRLAQLALLRLSSATLTLDGLLGEAARNWAVPDGESDDPLRRYVLGMMLEHKAIEVARRMFASEDAMALWERRKIWLAEFSNGQVERWRVENLLPLLDKQLFLAFVSFATTCNDIEALRDLRAQIAAAQAEDLGAIAPEERIEAQALIIIDAAIEKLQQPVVPVVVPVVPSVVPVVPPVVPVPPPPPKPREVDAVRILALSDSLVDDAVGRVSAALLSGANAGDDATVAAFTTEWRNAAGDVQRAELERHQRDDKLKVFVVHKASAPDVIVGALLVRIVNAERAPSIDVIAVGVADVSLAPSVLAHAQKIARRDLSVGRMRSFSALVRVLAGGVAAPACKRAGYHDGGDGWWSSKIDVGVKNPMSDILDELVRRAAAQPARAAALVDEPSELLSMTSTQVKVNALLKRADDCLSDVERREALAAWTNVLAGAGPDGELLVENYGVLIRSHARDSALAFELMHTWERAVFASCATKVEAEKLRVRERDAIRRLRTVADVKNHAQQMRAQMARQAEAAAAAERDRARARERAKSGGAGNVLDDIQRFRKND